MRIEQLILRRYGHFTDFSLDFSAPGNTESQAKGAKSGKPDFHILYGPNEAGKSTTLAGITDLLYGFDRVTPWKFLHGNELLEIEATLQQSEHSAVIKRFKTHLSNKDNDRLASFPLDLQGLSKEEYQQRFSFDEKTLKDGGDQILNSQGDVGQALFSASSGLADFTNRLDAILAPAYSFWTPGRKSKLRLNDLKKALQENKSQLNELKLDVKALQVKQSELEKCTVDLTDARIQKTEIAKKIKSLENQLSLYAVVCKWMHRKETLKELISLGIVTTNETQTLDLSSESKINTALDEIRHYIQNSQIAESRQEDLGKQLATSKALHDKVLLSDRDRLYLNTKDAINKLVENASAAIEWEHQQRDLDSEIDRCDAQIIEQRNSLGLAGNVDISEQLPTDSQLESMSKLFSEHQSIADRLQQAQADLNELQNQSPAFKEISSSEDSAERVSIVADVFNRALKENLVGQCRSAVDDESKAKSELNICAQNLGLSKDALENLQLPNQRIVFNHLEKLSKFTHAIQQLSQDEQNAESEIQLNKEKIKELKNLGAVDESAFNQSLTSRDSAWKHHVEQITSESGYSELKYSAKLFNTALRIHDETTTQRLTNGQKNAELKLLAEQLNDSESSAKSISEKLKSSLSELEKTGSELKLLIASFYDEHEIDNDLVREKLNLAAKLKELSIHYADRHQAVLDKKALCETQRTELLRVVSTIETESATEQLNTLGLQDLLHQLEKTLARKQLAANELKTQIAEQNLHQKNIDRSSRNISSYEKELSEWLSNWEALSKQSVMSKLDSNAARDAIPVIRELNKTVLRKNDAIQNRDELVSRIVNRNASLDALLKSLDASNLSNASNELAAAMHKAAEADQHSNNIRTTEIAIAEVLEAGLRDKNILESLLNECGADSPAKLIDLLQNTARYRATELLCAEELAQMTQISGEEPTAESLESFAESFDSEETRASIAELETEFLQSETFYEERHSSWVLATKALRDVGDNNDYAVLHQERANILLEIEEGAKNTAVALIGERVLKTAIGKFRQEHQSVLLTEAQEAFSTLTLGNYTSLVPRDDGRGNERLYAVDKNNKARAVEELSTGTRYQLYLALRAAAHADYARVRTPLPFVADDIMESFDDKRSAAAFEVLGKMAMNGQVLYLTHHQHLIPIAQEVLGHVNVQVHQLGH